MCTSIVTNFKKTIIGWNLDLLDMDWKVSVGGDHAYVMVYDKTEGYLPLFGANDRGDFVGMPTCWPYDAKSDKKSDEINIINLDIDFLFKKRTLKETEDLAKKRGVCSVTGLTFQSQLSDRDGNVLQITPGQCVRYLEKPKYSVMTNFSLEKMGSETHPWMGMDRYEKANAYLSEKGENFGVKDMFELLKSVAQTVCPTVVSMVFDATDGVVYWCENRKYDEIKSQRIISAI